VSKQRINDLLRHLERAGYLELDPDPSDDRAKIIRLTDRGWRLQDAALRYHREIEDEWADAVGEERWRQVRAALGDVTRVR
jgi:DNA-binding MarR family transcriptional regulator